MREILFRGKDENGVWRQGCYCVFNEKSYRIYTGFAETDSGSYYPDYYEVEPETVGQYTGLTDKNGQKIFEGDIVKIKGEIRFIFYGNSSFRHTNYGEYAAELTNVYTERDCEVIGNIHDNPELLRGDTK